MPPRSPLLQFGLCCCWLVLSVGCPLPEKAELAGVVVDADTLMPKAGVSVTWQEQSRSTDAGGRYSFVMPMGVHELQVSDGKRSIRRVVEVADTFDDTRSVQVQDVLFPNRDAEEDVFLVELGFAAGFESSTAPGSIIGGLLVADEHGNNGRFLDVPSQGAVSPNWDAQRGLVYYLDTQRKRGPFRHDPTRGTTELLRCEGLEVELDSKLCLAPNGDTALVIEGNTGFLLTGLTGDCQARALDASTVGPFGCEFTRAGAAFIGQISPDSKNRAQVVRVDLEPSVAEGKPVALISKWNARFPVPLSDGSLLVERRIDKEASSAGDGSIADIATTAESATRVETWQLDIEGERAARVSPTPEPVELVDNRLYYQARRDSRIWGIHLRHVDTERDVVLFNGARSLKRLGKWQ